METSVTVVGFDAAEQKILDSFHHHTPTEAQQAAIGDLRRGFRALAMRIIRSQPPSADRTAALRQLHEAMMTANKGIAVQGEKQPLGDGLD